MKKLLFTLLAFCALPTTVQAAETLTVYTYESFIAEWGPGPIRCPSGRGHSMELSGGRRRRGARPGP